MAGMRFGVQRVNLLAVKSAVGVFSNEEPEVTDHPTHKDYYLVDYKNVAHVEAAMGFARHHNVIDLESY